jgi:hypothetical protein
MCPVLPRSKTEPNAARRVPGKGLGIRIVLGPLDCSEHQYRRDRLNVSRPKEFPMVLELLTK